MEINNKAILVTGSHRSGSTWVGQMLALSADVNYVWEPFNPNNGSTDLWFQYVTEKNEALYFDRIMSLIFPSLKGITKSLRKSDNAKKSLRIIRNNLRPFNPLKKNLKPLLKDPIALISAPWVADTFSAQVVVIIRHPAAFVSSLKIKNWEFDFNNFLKQPLLMKEVLHDFEQEITDYATNKRDIIDSSCLVWRIFHQLILDYKKKYPNWIFLRHEDVSEKPVQVFEELYSALGLPFDTSIRRGIEEATGFNNPGEIAPDKHIFKRNSKENIFNWKKRLTESEIERIREDVQLISKEFYEDSEW